MGGSKDDLRRIYDAITGLWVWVRDTWDSDWETRIEKSYHGDDEFTARIYVAAIRELERVKK